ncbi:MAG: hypothetical protein RLY14_2837 [Planctomycetota bacterium]|jgi:hypothetical protein
MSNKLDSYINSGVEFRDLQYVVEIFPSPLPLEYDGEIVSDANDLLLTSEAYGFSEIFFPNTEKVWGVIDGKKVQFKREDFLAWQLLRATPATLYHLANKTCLDLQEMLDFDEEFAKNNSYDPDAWLNPYQATGESYANGLELVEKLRIKKPAQLISLLVSAMIDPNSGVLQGLETRVEDDLKSVHDSYSHWTVPLMVVSRGRFAPYIESGDSSNFKRDDYHLTEMYVRNFDEGDISN